ncbi:unnamed protein product [Symbiodinium natans]|uniref:Uncharacterized protein n=1 Tax=Symbiodinium natans TaxID=878477 RepID=A0A812LYH1_9DINO|nr:unnamed protein product [Symbiodinium natans]
MLAIWTRTSLQRRRNWQESSRNTETLWTCGSPDSQQDLLLSLMTPTRML